MNNGLKRKGQEYDEKFDPEMGYFLGSFNSIIKISNESTSRFNNCGSTSELKSLLNNEFENAKTELIETLSNTYLKIDKLNLLSEIANEIKSIKRLLVNYPIDESYSQEDSICLNEAVEKMNDFIDSQMQVLGSTNQNDYPIPYYMIPDKEASSIEKPLNYFEYLFSRNGIEHLRNNFIQYYSSDDYADSTYNIETETVTHNHYDIETGEWSETYSDFDIVFFEQLVLEYYISRKLIDNYVDEQKEETVIVFFIKRTLDKLNLLLSKIADEPETIKYKESRKPIEALISHIHNYHSLYVPQEMIPKVIVHEEMKSNLEQHPTKKMHSFKWKSEANLCHIIYLWDKLKENGFINTNTELTVFQKAFDGSILEAPLQIEWIALGKNNSSNKISLLYLINSLIDAKLVIDDLTNVNYLNTIEQIFCDSNKQQFKNLQVSNSSDLKKPTKTKQKKEIAAIIYELKQLVGSK
jgi:hypothetical protein